MYYLIIFQAKQKRNLKKHIEGVHEKKPLNCKKCPFSHRDQQALRRHVRVRSWKIGPRRGFRDNNSYRLFLYTLLNREKAA